MAEPMYPFRRPMGPQPSAPRPATEQSTRTATVAESADGSPVLPTTGDPRQAALQMLLDKASLYGDQGASTATIQNVLDGVDMGRADRTASLYATRQKQLQDADKTYLDALSAALTKKRQQAGRRRVGPTSPTRSTGSSFMWTPFSWQQFFPLGPPSAPGSSGTSARGGSNRGSVDY